MRTEARGGIAASSFAASVRSMQRGDAGREAEEHAFLPPATRRCGRVGGGPLAAGAGANQGQGQGWGKPCAAAVHVSCTVSRRAVSLVLEDYAYTASSSLGTTWSYLASCAAASAHEPAGNGLLPVCQLSHWPSPGLTLA